MICCLANPKALSGIVNGIILGNLAHLTGFLVIISYATLIFEKVGAMRIDPAISSISLALLQVVGTLCTTKFSDSLGRKTLLQCSLLGSAVGMISFASYSYLKQTGYELSAFEWLPMASLSLTIFAASSGVVPLTSICTVENMPTKV